MANVRAAATGGMSCIYYNTLTQRTWLFVIWGQDQAKGFCTSSHSSLTGSCREDNYFPPHPTVKMKEQGLREVKLEDPAEKQQSQHLNPCHFLAPVTFLLIIAASQRDKPEGKVEAESPRSGRR